ncbi:MAG: nodulation protein NfeD [Bdellovibrionota bacterium]
MRIPSFLMVLSLWLGWAPTIWANSDPETSTVLYKVNIEGAIHEGTVHILEKAYQDIEAQGAWGLLICLDTPGGILDSTRTIVKQMLGSRVPTIVYVSPSGSRAGSAGTFITMAANIAVMAPGTNIGAAHPVTATGKDPEEGSEHMGKKIENDTLAFIAAIARQRGRNIQWARLSVSDSASITAEEALELNVIDMIAQSEAELLKKMDGMSIQIGADSRTLHTSNLRIKNVEIDWKMKFFNRLAHPTVIFALLAIAGLGFYAEFSHPGMIFPAVTGGISLLLFLVASSVIPINTVGILLMALAFACFIAEIFITSFGLLTLAGSILLGAGGFFLFDPNTSDFSIPHGMLASISLGCALVGAIIAYAVGKTLGMKQHVGKEYMLGAKATVVDRIDAHQGKIFLMGEYWEARSSHPIEKNEQVEIVALNDLIAQVKKVTTQTNA